MWYVWKPTKTGFLFLQLWKVVGEFYWDGKQGDSIGFCKCYYFSHEKYIETSSGFVPTGQNRANMKDNELMNSFIPMKTSLDE